MATVTIDQAKMQLSNLIARAEAGEDVVILRDNNPVARLTAVRSRNPRLRFGMLKGKLPNLPDEFFFDPLPEDELQLWEGSGEDPIR